MKLRRSPAASFSISAIFASIMAALGSSDAPFHRRFELRDLVAQSGHLFLERRICGRGRMLMRRVGGIRPIPADRDQRDADRKARRYSEVRQIRSFHDAASFMVFVAAAERPCAAHEDTFAKDMQSSYASLRKDSAYIRISPLGCRNPSLSHSSHTVSSAARFRHFERLPEARGGIIEGMIRHDGNEAAPE